MAAKPGGIVAFWVAAVAFLVMALWRLVETTLGRSTDPKSQGAPSELLDRAKAFVLAVVYFAFAYSTFGFAPPHLADPGPLRRPADSQGS